jgi:hypothetical protein
LYNGGQLTLFVFAFTFASLSLGAQTAPYGGDREATASEMPIGIFRGSLLGSRGAPGAGDLTIRAQTMDLVCHYDAHSYVARNHHRIAVSSLGVGEPLEILANHKPGSQACYASMVQVIDIEAERMAAERSRRARTQNFGARSVFFTPRGDRDLAGMVVRLTSRLLTLRTRNGETTLALRPDTRYWGDGLGATPADLQVNTHVFIHAGRSAEGVVEAYQVMWGKILDVQ